MAERNGGHVGRYLRIHKTKYKRSKGCMGGGGGSSVVWGVGIFLFAPVSLTERKGYGIGPNWGHGELCVSITSQDGRTL